MSTNIRLALVQEARGPDPGANIDRSVVRIQEAAAAGAQVICLQELFASRYFPQRVDVAHCALAEALPSPTSARMAALAGELGVTLVVPVFEEGLPGVRFNTALTFGPTGDLLGKYRKNHIPDGVGYQEKYYFAPGDLGYPVVEAPDVRLGVGICWDEWFPEVARIFALGGAQLLLYPSAIGSEPERPGYSSRDAWRTVIRSHAIANGVFVGVVNRVGREDDHTFYGGSFVVDPFGEVIAEADDREQVLLADLSLDRIREFRDLMHCMRDRRVDTYGPLLRRVIETGTGSPGDD